MSHQGKNSRQKNRERRAKDRRAEKTASIEQQKQWSEAGKAAGSARALKFNRASKNGSVTVNGHPDDCGNIGCAKCYPEYHRRR